MLYDVIRSRANAVSAVAKVRGLEQKRSAQLNNNRVDSRISQQPGKMLVGIDIGGTKTAVVLSPRAPDVIWRKEFTTAPAQGPADATQRIIELTAQGLYETG